MLYSKSELCINLSYDILWEGLDGAQEMQITLRNFN